MKEIANSDTIRDPRDDHRELIIFTLSDSSGETAESVARAAVVQFPPGRASIYRLPQVKTLKQIESLVREVSGDKAVIAYTLVLPEYRETLEREARKYNIATIDLLGSLIDKVSQLTGQTPLSQPGRLHLLDESYYRRIEALEFAIRFDDGKNPDGLLEADVILIGVSRTSKTPNCIYLAHHYGLKAANVPLVYGVDPPLNLYQVPSRRIVGLHLEPVLLQEIRSARAQSLKMPGVNDYADLDRIREEVRYARKTFRELKCHIIDVSAKAIEEISSEVYLHLRQ
ncbi:MAG TPA: pyruvate, water dikinase regulatory protein [Candidatus Melainabacteria bacterium]|nr:pyruvate, water dikinase regulatory protein [Candidatus Melainabacteria bacterium]HMP51322.1 pyruvate, water dikinase regulatory protein [Candidatus Melainabacteria bacterium]